MTNGYGSQQICLHCMSSYVVGGRCRRCGRVNTDEERTPLALPFGYRLYTPRQRCYQLGKVLGSGGFGITYLAWDQQAKRPVAVKELFILNRCFRNKSTMSVIVEAKHATLFQHCRKRFLDEACVIASFRSTPEIIDIFDYFEANGTGYYVMEYLHGMDMQHWLEQRQAPFSWHDIESPLGQVLHCLEILHQHGFIHRDISPDNIFVCNDGKAKLIDFGSVRSQSADHFTVFLKKGYAPPEQFLSDGNQGPWTDTFSLCGTVYYLLSDKHPVQSYDRIKEIDAKKQDPLVPLGQYKPDAPAEVIQAVMHGLNLDETKRFQNAAEMRKAFFPGRHEVQTAEGCVLECVNGVYAGREFPIPKGSRVSFGRSECNATVIYPADTPAVSRPQCEFWYYTNDKLYVQDLNSRYGTYLGQARISPSRWIEVQPGQSIRFGREVLVFKKS